MTSWLTDSAPTSIYCRQKGERFEAVAKIVHGHTVSMFTERPITDPGELHAVARMAGDEARRIDLGGGIRTWEQLRSMTEEERTEGMASWPKLTDNKVALYVSEAQRRR